MSSPTDAAGSPLAISIEDVQSARDRIRGLAHVTPVFTCETMNEFATKAASENGHEEAMQLFFKNEALQKIGAFKFRGAMNAVQLALASAAEPSKLVVVTHSSGNHAQALALAAKQRGVRSIIVMPSNAPAVKVDGVRGYGGEVIFCAPTQAAREAAAAEQVALHAPHALLVPPYDHAWVMAGQGTLALEFLEQVADLDALVVPVGGGGMLAGVCVAAKAIKPTIRIFAAEPADADDAFQSLVVHGERTPLKAPTNTVADGLRTSLGLLTYPVLREHVSGVILASETEIVANMKLVFERMKLVIEPSAGVGVAAVMSKQFHTYGPDAKGPMCRDNNPNVVGMEAVRDLPIKRVGIVLCGGNVDLDALPWLKK